MVEYPSRVLRQDDPTTTNEASSSKKKSRHPVIDDDSGGGGGGGGGGEAMKCSRVHCSSCTANLVADCIAVCCCPCAIVNMLILAFVKVPWMMGKRCLRFMKKKRKMLEKNKDGRNRVKWSNSEEMISMDVVIERDNRSNLRSRERVLVEEKIVEFTSGFLDDGDGGGGDQQQNFCARFEAERVWLELYQMGHLGFGRVSFSGSQGKGN